MQITFLIPCLNEAQTVTKVVRQAITTGKKNFPHSFEVMVADNGSRDGSLEKLAKLQRRYPKIVRVIHVPVRGYGAALHWGIMKARGRYVIYADADLSYDFAEVKKFVAYVRGADVILGSRFHGTILPGAMPALHRYFGTPALTLVIRFLYHLPVSDCNSGMRMVRKSFYAKLRMHNSGMEWASELLIKTALHHGKYVEVPITLRPDQRKRPPHLLSWIDGWRHLKAIVLLKPNSLLVVVGLLTMAGFLSNSLSFFFFLAAFGLLFSTLAAKLLQFAIDETPSMSVTVLQKLPVVSSVIVLNFLSGAAIFLLPNLPVEVKFALASAVVVIDVWVFHIETIKTHVMYRLPNHLPTK